MMGGARATSSHLLPRDSPGMGGDTGELPETHSIVYQGAQKHSCCLCLQQEVGVSTTPVLVLFLLLSPNI